MPSYNPRRGSSTSHRYCDRIAELAQTLALALEDAAGAGSRKSSGGLQFVGRGQGFSDTDPTGTLALDPRRSQIRLQDRGSGLSPAPTTVSRG
jgi:hypothetical protein